MRRAEAGIATAVAVAVGVLVALPLLAHGQLAVRNQGFVPFSDPPIDYRAEPDDPVAQLQRRLDRGESRLSWHPVHGYLPSVLDRLGISSTSQMLVFSKTSFQYRRISPATPRALYFNDDVYVGKAQGGRALEVIAFDPRKGAIFYLLDDQPVEHPVFRRAELDCTVCHVAPATRNVPGVLMRSVFPLPSGAQAGRAPAFVIGHDSPFAERFGGWYVTGDTGTQRHLGNATVPDSDHPTDLDRNAGANLASLEGRFDLAPYLTPHSDVVAQLVHAHQTQTHNVLTRTSFFTRIALHEQAAGNRAAGRPDDAMSAVTQQRVADLSEELVRSLLFADEAPLVDTVRGSSEFTATFQGLGPRDRRGRSLRDFDLRRRLFRYPLSYLVYSDTFDALPEPAKGLVYGRLLEILTGDPAGDEFWWLDRTDRRAIFDILLDTKHGLPAAWPSAGRTATGIGAVARSTTGRQRGSRPTFTQE